MSEMSRTHELYSLRSHPALPPRRQGRLLTPMDYCRVIRLRSATESLLTPKPCSVKRRLGFVLVVINGQKNGRDCRTLFALSSLLTGILMLKTVGFVPIPDWPSVFRHPGLGTFLVIYVDDFKQSGPSATLAEGRKLISSVINMEDPRPLKRYLGCEHEFRSAVIDGPFDPRTAWTVSHPPSKSIPEIRFGSSRKICRRREQR